MLRRPTINNLKVVTSTYHLRLKLPTTAGVGEVRGEQVLTRECFVQELKSGAGDVCTIKDPSSSTRPPPTPEFTTKEEEVRDEQPFRQVETNEPLELASLDSSRPEIRVRIGSRMGPDMRRAMKQLLTEH